MSNLDLIRRMLYMKTGVICGIRMTVKVLLCISLIISTGLLLNYMRNLNPTADGFDVTNLIARLVHGDDYWNWQSLTTGLSTAWILFAVLFCADKIVDAAYKKPNQ